MFGSLSNGAGQYLFAGNTAQGALRRALLAFDLSNLPANAQLTRAALTLTLSRTNSFSGDQPHTLHRVLAAWGEGLSDAGTPGATAPRPRRGTPPGCTGSARTPCGPALGGTLTRRPALPSTPREPAANSFRRRACWPTWKPGESPHRPTKAGCSWATRAPPARPKA